MTSSPLLLADARALFRQIAPKACFDELIARHKLDRREGIYRADVVFNLMMQQELDQGGTLSTAVASLAAHPQRLNSNCKRVREDRVSSGTAGYCRARQKLPSLIVSEMTDHILSQLRGLLGQEEMKVFLIDGSTVQLAHSPSLLDAFSSGANQHGENHWPILHLVVFHDLVSGLAMRPTWGPKYGKKAVSEQSLAKQGLDRLPAGATVMADINFGIFAFAFASDQSGRKCLLRMQRNRAKALLGREPGAGMEENLVWNASRYDRKSHPDLPAEAQVTGRLLVFEHPADPTELLCLFTTLDLSADQILELYGKRWNVELDLRSLKRTIGIHQLTSKSVDMMEKELLVAVSAYNLVRAAICLAALQAGISPRRLSFSRAQDIVRAELPGLQQAPTEEEFNRLADRMLRRLAQCRLPQRPNRRSYPRQVWGKGGQFPRRRNTPVVVKGN
jgi:putative transposase